MTAAVDSSVIVAAFAGWHEDHEIPLETLATSRPRLIAHCAMRTTPWDAVYDGLVGLVAAENGLELLSLDRRAELTYRSCGMSYRLLRR